MRSWQHNICNVKKFEGNYLFTGETIELIKFERIEWACVVDKKGILITPIEPSTEFFNYTNLDRCIEEGIFAYKLPLLFSDEDDSVVVFYAKEDGSFSME